MTGFSRVDSNAVTLEALKYSDNIHRADLLCTFTNTHIYISYVL